MLDQLVQLAESAALAPLVAEEGLRMMPCGSCMHACMELLSSMLAREGGASCTQASGMLSIAFSRTCPPRGCRADRIQACRVRSTFEG
jgi:hypothetical protein